MTETIRLSSRKPMPGYYVVAICDENHLNECFPAKADSPAESILKAVLQYAEKIDKTSEHKSLPHFKEGIAAFDQARLNEVEYLLDQFLQWGLYISEPLTIA